MLRIQRALLVELLVVFLGVLVVVTAVVFAGTTLHMVSRGEGVGVRLMLDRIPHLLPIALSYSLPFSWLAAVVLVLGRMVTEHEVTALRAAGVHLRLIVLPVLAASVLLAVGGMLFNVTTVPEAQRTIREGWRRHLVAFLGSLGDAERSVTLSNGRFSYARFEDGSFWDVELDQRDGDGRLKVKVVARRVRIGRVAEAEAGEALRFVFDDAWIVYGGKAEGPSLDFHREARLHMGRVERIGTSVLFNEFFATSRYIDRPKDMSLPALLYALERGGVWRGTRWDVELALHTRLALGASPFVLGFFALGMTLLLPATGRRVRDFLLPFLPAVAVFFPSFIAGASVAKGGIVPPWLAMWSGSLMLGVAGLALLWGAVRR